FALDKALTGDEESRHPWNAHTREVGRNSSTIGWVSRASGPTRRAEGRGGPRPPRGARPGLGLSPPPPPSRPPPKRPSGRAWLWRPRWPADRAGGSAARRPPADRVPDGPGHESRPRRIAAQSGGPDPARSGAAQ